MSAERIYNLIEEEKNQEGSVEQAESQPGGGVARIGEKARLRTMQMRKTTSGAVDSGRCRPGARCAGAGRRGAVSCRAGS